MVRAKACASKERLEKGKLVAARILDGLIGDGGDARLDIFLRENWYQFLRGRAEFLSPPMFFPIKGTLGYSDAYLLDGLIYVPLRIIGLDPFLSFELFCIGISLVGFISANILLMRFASHHERALASGQPETAEYDFVTFAGYHVLCRGALLPLSADGVSLDHVYGVVSWKSEKVANQAS